MRTRLSKSFDRKVDVYQANADGTFTLVLSVWARVQDVNYENYDSAGQSIDKFDKKVITRAKDLDTNLNAFLIDGTLHQIDRVETNYKKTQYTYYVNNANVTI